MRSTSVLRCIAPLLATALLCLHFPAHVSGSQAETEELLFTILHTNDMHSALIPHSPAVDYHPDFANPATGGFPRLAAAINSIRAEKQSAGEPVLVFDAGDFLGGSAFGWLSTLGEAPELILMQQMGYDAVIIGNHEYDYGPDILAGYLMAAGYPEAHASTLVLGSNTRAPEDHLLSSGGLYLDVEIFELDNGLRIGVFGLIGKDAVSVTADTGSIEFLDQHETARANVEKLTLLGADLIIAITHSGVDEDRQLARSVKGIDVIIGGHCHTPLHQPMEESGTIIAQAGSGGQYLGKLELAFNPATASLRVRDGDESSLIKIDTTFEPDVSIAGEVSRFTGLLNNHISDITGGAFSDIMQVVAVSDFTLGNEPRLNETPIANFITDAMRFVTREVTGHKVDVAIQANGSIRQPVIPGSMDYSRGHISFYEIAETIGLGFGSDGYAGYPVVSVYLTGEEVRRLLEVAVLLQELLGDTFFLQFSGLRYSYNPANAVLFTVPFLNLPVPTTRAVTSAEFYTGEGIQPAEGPGYEPVKAGDTALYHVVADTYILSYLPMVGDMLPGLEILPKNASGEVLPEHRFSEFTVHHDDGRELKVWETVVMYAASQPMGISGAPQIPEYYSDTAGRINTVWSFPLIVWPLVLLAVLAAALVALVRWLRHRRGAQKA